MKTHCESHLHFEVWLECYHAHLCPRHLFDSIHSGHGPIVQLHCAWIQFRWMRFHQLRLHRYSKRLNRSKAMNKNNGTNHKNEQECKHRFPVTTEHALLTFWFETSSLSRPVETIASIWVDSFWGIEPSPIFTSHSMSDWSVSLTVVPSPSDTLVSPSLFTPTIEMCNPI